MILKIIIVLLLVGLSGIAKAVTDKVNFHDTNSVFPPSWWVQNSWLNKWKLDETGYPVQPKKERFPLSSTVLVLFTDAWHFFEAIKRLFLFGALSFALVGFSDWRHFLGCLAGLFIVHAAVFHVFFHYVFQKKEPLT